MKNQEFNLISSPILPNKNLVLVLEIRPCSNGIIMAVCFLKKFVLESMATNPLEAIIILRKI
jgi:hypothetical protein